MPIGAAVVEFTLGGLALRALDAATVACTGASCPGARLGRGVHARPGAVVRFGAAGARAAQLPRGTRRVGVAAELGSRSTDLLSGLGPAPLASGDRLPVGPTAARAPSGTAAVPAGRRPN